MDLASLDLDGPDGSEASSSIENDSSRGGESHNFGGVNGHNDSSHIGLYYHQSWKNHLGRTGIVILSFFSISLVMAFGALFLSYTAFGKKFLQQLVFNIF